MDNKKAAEILRAIKAGTAHAFLNGDAITSALDTAIDVLEKQERNRWHSIAKEGNPKERGFYLWTSKDGTVREDLYRICDNTWTWCIAWRDGYEVVAWRPLPEPYTEEEV